MVTNNPYLMEMQPDWKYVPMPDIIQNIFNKDNLPTYHELYDYFLKNNWNEYGNVGYDTDEYKNSVMDKIITWINARLFNMVLPIKADNDRMINFCQLLVNKYYMENEPNKQPYRVADVIGNIQIPTNADGSFDQYLGPIHTLKRFPYYNTGYIGFNPYFGIEPDDKDMFTSVPLTDDEKRMLIDIWFPYVIDYYKHVADRAESDKSDSLHDRALLKRLSEEYRMEIWNDSLKIPIDLPEGECPQMLTSYFLDGVEHDDIDLKTLMEVFEKNEHTLNFNVASRLGWSLMKRMRVVECDSAEVCEICVHFETDNGGYTTSIQMLKGSPVSVYTGELVKENHNVFVPGTKHVPIEDVAVGDKIRVVHGTHEYDGVVTVSCEMVPPKTIENFKYIELLPRTGINISSISFTWPTFQYVN